MIDSVLATMFTLGLTRDDVRHLEKLSDPRVLRRLGVTHLRRNVREDVVRYMRAWRAVLAESLHENTVAQLG